MSFLKRLLAPKKNSPVVQPISAEYERELYNDWLHVGEGILAGAQAKGVKITNDVARQVLQSSLDIVAERRNLPPGRLVDIVNRRCGKADGSDKTACLTQRYMY